VGDKTVVELLTHFRSLKRIKEVALEDLTQVIGAARAAKIYNYYHQD